MATGQGRLAILDAIRDCLAEGGNLGVMDLPDEPDHSGGLRSVPGARDGITTHHAAGDEPDDAVDAVVEAVVLACRDGAVSDPTAEISALAGDLDLVRMLNAIVDRVRRSAARPRRVYELALRLASTSSERGPVKLGIALLGIFAVDGHREVLLTLGRHEEFTLYSAVALASQRDSTDDLWSLAREVHGWGRVHLVERLADTTRADVLDWILREGFRNSIADEYLAYVAVTRADLRSRLAGEDVDDDLLHAAGDLLTALFADGPTFDIQAYTDGAAVTVRFVELMRHRARDLRHLLAVAAVRRFASRPPLGGRWPAGWTDEVRDGLAGASTEIIAWPRWPALAEEAMRSADRQTFLRGEQAAELLGLPALPVLLERLRRDPFDASLWFYAMRRVSATTVGDVVGLAERVLPLADIATGPADEVGLGSRYATHQCLDLLLQSLRAWPGTGWPLVRAGLASPVVRNRHMAVRVLVAWPREAWPAEAATVLRSASAVEPLPDIRHRMTALVE